MQDVCTSSNLNRMPSSLLARTDRVAREQHAHTERDVLAENMRIKSRFAHIGAYPSLKRLRHTLASYTTDLSGQRVLDYGCGRGHESLTYLAQGAAHVSGIDISPVYIEDAHNRAVRAGFAANRFSFQVMDAHDLMFPAQTFDLVIGLGILHHLDPDVALDEIHRVLRPGGRVLLLEPLADNPLLKLFRYLTPHARTEDEAPFTGAQIQALLQRSVWHPELAYCGLFELPIAMLTSVCLPVSSDNMLLRAAHRLEQWAHKTKLLPSWNQYVLFNMTKG